jgi:hypothetical protein
MKYDFLYRGMGSDPGSVRYSQDCSPFVLPTPLRSWCNRSEQFEDARRRQWLLCDLDTKRI